jgi:hypothetical protein
LLGQDGNYWIVPTSVLPATWRVGASYSMRAKVSWQDRNRKTGALTEISEAVEVERPPRFFLAYRPPVPHAGSSPELADLSLPGRQIKASALKKCRRCNWALLRNQQGLNLNPRREVHTWSIRCIYPHFCEIHIMATTSDCSRQSDTSPMNSKTIRLPKTP